MRRLYHRPVLRGAPGTKFDVQACFAPADPEISLPDYEALASLFDGSRSLEDIFGELLLSGFEVESILTVLDRLDEAGLLTEAPDSELNRLPEAEKQYFAEQIRALAAFGGSGSGVSPWPVGGVSAQAVIRKATAVVVGSGVDAVHLIRLLVHAGVGDICGVSLPTDEPLPKDFLLGPLPYEPGLRLTSLDQPERLPSVLPTSCDVVVYCPEQFDEDLCQQLNAFCLANSIRLLPYRREPFQIDIGPLILPRETACYACFQARLRGIIVPPPPPRELPPMRLRIPVYVDWLALEIVKILTGVIEPTTRGRLCSANLITGLMELHPVLKLPRCSACGVHKNSPLRKLWEEC